MSLDHRYEEVRRRAPQSLDIAALMESVRARNDAMIAEWRERLPGAASAVLEITVMVSGQQRRRLRRYREFADASRGQPGVLTLRQPTGFDDILDFRLVEIIAAAARAEVSDIDWRLLTVSEALREGDMGGLSQPLP